MTTFDVVHRCLRPIAGLMLALLFPLVHAQPATGGTVIQNGSVYTHVFNESGNFTVSSSTLMCTVLVVGGGGGGGGSSANAMEEISGGGGGGGGLIERYQFTISAGTYAIVVGRGGQGGAGDWWLAGTAGIDGESSSAFGLAAPGGGGGGAADVSGRTGGSGGGGAELSHGGPAVGGEVAGNPGGEPFSCDPEYTGGGGGGADGTGYCGDGGNARACDLLVKEDGVSTYWLSGGGAGGINLESGMYPSTAEEAGQPGRSDASPNHGGGGAGGLHFTEAYYNANPDFFSSWVPRGFDGTNGGAGIVVISYVFVASPSAPPWAQTATSSPTAIGLSWGLATPAAGGNALAGYYVYRNGTQLNSQPLLGTSYTDSTVTAGTAYVYTVKAVDTVGALSTAATLNVSAPASSTSGTFEVYTPTP